MKEKIIGLILIILGALPLILKIEKINTPLSKINFLSYIIPGEMIYQVIIIILGILLIWKLKTRTEFR